MSPVVVLEILIAICMSVSVAVDPEPYVPNRAAKSVYANVIFNTLSTPGTASTVTAPNGLASIARDAATLLNTASTV